MLLTLDSDAFWVTKSTKVHEVYEGKSLSKILYGKGFPESAGSRGLLRSVAGWIEYVKLRPAEILVCVARIFLLSGQPAALISLPEMERCRPEITARTRF